MKTNSGFAFSILFFISFYFLYYFISVFLPFKEKKSIIILKKKERVHRSQGSPHLSYALHSLKNVDYNGRPLTYGDEKVVPCHRRVRAYIQMSSSCLLNCRTKMSRVANILYSLVSTIWQCLFARKIYAEYQNPSLVMVRLSQG